MKTLKRILNADVLFSAAVLVVCVVFYSMASALSHTGGSSSVDAGMFPRLIAVVTAIFASIQIYHGIRDQKGYFTVTEKEKPNQKLFFMTIALVALYIAAWNIVPFIPRTLLLLVALCKLMRLSWKFTILYSAILSVGLYYIFANVFRILL